MQAGELLTCLQEGSRDHVGARLPEVLRGGLLARIASPAADENLQIREPGPQSFAQVPGMRQAARWRRHEADQGRFLPCHRFEKLGRERRGSKHFEVKAAGVEQIPEHFERRVIRQIVGGEAENRDRLRFFDVSRRSLPRQRVARRGSRCPVRDPDPRQSRELPARQTFRRPR